MKRTLIRINRVIDQPKIALGKLRGYHPNQVYSILTARSLVNEDFQTIIDVGANYGHFLKPAKWLFPSAGIHGFEPVREAFMEITKIPGIRTWFFGLGDKNEEIDFYYNSKVEANSTFLKPIINKKDFKKRKALIKRFDGLVYLGLRNPCFVKIDAEGFELNVLKGFGKKLKEVDVVQIEYHFTDFFENRTKLSEILILLEENGFTKFIQTEYHEHGCDLMFYK